jgi:ElaB/YqjD/DUF883 family membrane-anchored ribosome-binding protein
MNSELVETTTGAGIDFAHLTNEISKAKVLVEDVIEDGKRKAQRMMKRGYSSVEDCVDETTHYIKHHPWQSMGIALGVGAGAGVLCGWLLSRNGGNRAAAAFESDFYENFHSGE